MIQRIAGRLPGRRPAEPESAREIKLRLLSEAEMFRDLTLEDMKEIEQMTVMTTCDRGRVFYTPGQNNEVLFVLKRGRVQLYRPTPDGKRLVVATLEKGAVFGDMPLLLQQMQDNSAEAIEDCTLCIMSRSDVMRLMEVKPRVGLNVIRILAERVAELERQLEVQAFQTVPQRLAATLIRLADGRSEISSISHQQLGEVVGAARETVTRVLGEFQASGLIELGRSHITILDARRLTRLAKPE